MTDPTIVTRAINDASDAARMLRVAARDIRQKQGVSW